MSPSPNRSRAGSRLLDEPDSSTLDNQLDIAELHGNLGYLVRRLQVAIFRNFMTTLAPMNVRPAQYSVLVLIAANPGSSQAAIGLALNIERARLARMLHELERREWVERRNRDGRSHALFLTGAGRKALKSLQELVARHEDEVAELIGHKRRTQLMDLLKDVG